MPHGDRTLNVCLADTAGRGFSDECVVLRGNIRALSVYANSHAAAPRITIGLKGDKTGKPGLHVGDNLAAPASRGWIRWTRIWANSAAGSPPRKGEGGRGKALIREVPPRPSRRAARAPQDEESQIALMVRTRE